MYCTQLPVHSIYNRKDKDLEQYHKDELQSTDEFNEKCKKAVNALASFLKERSGFIVAETVKVNIIHISIFRYFIEYMFIVNTLLLRQGYFPRRPAFSHVTRAVFTICYIRNVLLTLNLQ